MSYYDDFVRAVNDLCERASVEVHVVMIGKSNTTRFQTTSRVMFFDLVGLTLDESVRALNRTMEPIIETVDPVVILTNQCLTDFSIELTSVTTLCSVSDDLSVTVVANLKNSDYLKGMVLSQGLYFRMVLE